MNRIVFIASIMLVAGARIAWAQPVVSGWRPPTGCASNDVIKFNGTSWVCGSASGFSTNNVVPKGNGTGLVASRATDDGTTFVITSSATRFAFDGAHYFDISPRGNHDVSLITSGGALYIANYGATNSASFGLNGNLAVNSTFSSSFTGTGAGDTLNVTYSGTAQAANHIAVNAQNSGTYDTTAAGRNAYAVVGNVTATRSAGANNLNNIAAYLNASGAQVNLALQTDNGGVILNALSGTTQIGSGSAGSLTVNGTTTATTNSTGATVTPLTVTRIDGATLNDITQFTIGQNGAQVTLRTITTNTSDLSADFVIGARWFNGVDYNNEDLKINGGNFTIGASAGRTHTINGATRHITTDNSDALIIGTASKHWSWYTNGGALRLFEYTTTCCAGGSDRLTIAPGGAMVIKTTTPGGGVQAAPVGTVLSVEQTDGNTNYVTVRGNSLKGLVFANAFSGIDGFIQYDLGSAPRAMGLGTANAVRQVIDTNGAIFVGDSANTAVANNVDVLTIGNTGTGQTGNKSLIKLTHTGSIDTTAGTTGNNGINISISTTRSAGGNNLENIAALLSASGGQSNLALMTNNGDVRLNNLSGTTTANGQMFFNKGIELDGVTTYVTGAPDSGITVNQITLGTMSSFARVRIQQGGDGTATAIGGITGGSDGAIYLITNVGTTGLAFWNEYSSATSTSRFQIANSSFLVLYPNETALFLYDTSVNRWLIFGGSLANLVAEESVTSGYIVASGDATLGDDITDVISVTGTATINGSLTVTDGIKGFNKYASKHLEWGEEFMAASQSNSWTGTNVPYTGMYFGKTVGSGADIGYANNVQGRPGVADLSTGTVSSGMSILYSSPAAINFMDGAWTFGATVAFDALSASTQDYVAYLGFANGESATRGCFFIYDRSSAIWVPTVGGTGGNNWMASCADGSGNQVVVKLDGTTNGGFSTTACPISGGVTWPSTNVYRLEVTVSGGTATFKSNGTTCTTLTGASIPNAASEVNGTTLGITKVGGTTERHLYIDQVELSADLSIARSP